MPVWGPSPEPNRLISSPGAKKVLTPVVLLVDVLVVVVLLLVVEHVDG